MPEKLYEVRDPVHNFILFNDFEKRLINSPPVQRLKYIQQLALTYEVYPGGTHSRFEHSLGTMELATQAFETIVRRPGSAFAKLGWSNGETSNYRQLLRIAALLHDIGHAPFSHAPENLLPAGYSGHESFTETLIRSDYITPLLEMKAVNLDVGKVVAVALGPEKAPQEDPSLLLLQELLAGDLGVDRMDYLVRDALHTGAAAGRFDYQRLLNTLTVIDHPDTHSPVLAIEAGGRHAAEGLLLARYFMFLQVYFHEVRRIYDCHLVDFLSAWLPGGHFPSELGSYIKLTDNTVHAAIAGALNTDGRLAELALRLRGRQHYRLAYTVTTEEKKKDPDIFPKLSEQVSALFGDGVRVDEVGKEAHTLDPGKLYTVSDEGEARDILSESDLIRSLKPVWYGRIYSHPDIQKDVDKACKEFIGKEGAAA
jgi:hypothetical protein